MFHGAGIVDIFKSVLSHSGASPSLGVAEFLAAPNFSADDHARYAVLAETARCRDLTTREAGELDSYLEVDALLTALRLNGERAFYR